MSGAVPREGEQEQPQSWVSQTLLCREMKPASSTSSLVHFGAISKAQQMSLQVLAAM